LGVVSKNYKLTESWSKIITKLSNFCGANLFTEEVNEFLNLFTYHMEKEKAL